MVVVVVVVGAVVAADDADADVVVFRSFLSLGFLSFLSRRLEHICGSKGKERARNA